MDGQDFQYRNLIVWQKSMQFEMAKELGYLETIDEVETLAAEISRMLTTLMKKYTPLSNSNSKLQLKKSPPPLSNSNSFLQLKRNLPHRSPTPTLDSN